MDQWTNGQTDQRTKRRIKPLTDMVLATVQVNIFTDKKMYYRRTDRSIDQPTNRPRDKHYSIEIWMRVREHIDMILALFDDEKKNRLWTNGPTDGPTD